MKKGIFLPSLIGLLALSCTVQEIETQNHPYEPAPGDDVFYASLAPESDTKVHVDKIDEQIKTLWDENDQISIFNKNTVNQQYEFMGNTGDNAGYFKRVSEEAVAVGNGGYVCAVYPFSQATSLNEGVLTLTLPKKQTYREGSYGLEANTMVSTTDGKNNLLRFKNVGGYLVLKFYGTQMVDGEEKAITIKSIKLEGRNGELLSGKATMTPVIGELPIIEMAETAGTDITLDANKVKLGKNAGKATEFWMVVPPTVFSEGFLLTVTDKDNKVFTKETDQRLVIERNGVLRIAPIEVKPALPLDPDKVIYYTTSDKNVVAPAEGAGFGANIVSNDYVDLKGILAFDGSVTTIGANAFAGCETLTGMTIPSTVTSIGESAFARCTSLGAPNTPSGADITEPTKGPNRSGETTFVIPYGVTTIGAHAFEDCTSLTSIIIPEGVTTIGAYAFSNCTSLTSITIPSTVISIGDQAFAGCSNLSSIDLPENVEMGTNVFMGRTGITSITIPEGTTSIGDYAYAWCTNLTEVIIPDSVTSIGDYAFFTCSNLTSIDISHVTTIGKHAFDDCENLAGITIPAGVTKIKEGTFAACHAFTSIVIPEGVTSIGDAAFDSCSNLTNVKLPSSLTSIGEGAFDFCSKLTSIVIPSQVTVICPNTFEGCTALTSITLPENIIIIDDAAFRECKNLNFITVLAAIPPEVKENSFEDTNNCPIYVPAESLADYKIAEGWSYYTSRIHTIGSADGMIQGHAYVDMGTGLKWATMNVGSATESAPGERFDWPGGMAAVEEWGGNWRLPTREELATLIDESKFTWTWDSTNYGCWVESLIAGFEGNRIFLPAAGLYDPTDPDWYIARTGFYWSSTFETDPYYLEFDLDDEECPVFMGAFDYNIQISLRPVAD